MLRATILALALVPALADAAERVLVHDGETRRYLIEEPAGAGPAPAIVLLHGGGGRAEQLQRHAGFDLTPHGFVQIYPDALNKEWNDGRRTLAGEPFRTTDDVGFLRQMLEELIAEGRVDRDRIYFAGISNGGAMTQRMLCQAPDLAAGGVSVAMNFPVGLDCPNLGPRPILYILGTEDPIVPFEGGPITIGRRDRGAVMPALDSVDFFARRAGCRSVRSEAMPDTDPGDGTRSVLTRYTGCVAPVEMIAVDGGGHTWPGARARPLLGMIVGTTARDFDATQVISRFFRDLAGQ